MKIVAEIGAAHNGSLERATDTIIAAWKAGADAVKFQTWTPDAMDAGGRVLDSGPWKGHSLKDLYRKAHTPWEWHKPLIAAAQTCGIEWFSTPFDYASVAFLESLGCPRYKVASFEIVDIPLIKRIAQTGKPIILSTGMATETEIYHAVDACGTSPYTLLRCVSAYPASPEDFNLETMCDMGRRWECPVGLSDHSRGVSIQIAAAVMGASMIERHITLEPGDGLDDGFASLPSEFASMVSSVRTALSALGRVKYGPAPQEAPSMALRRSLWVLEDIPAGSTLTTRNIGSRRPADGLEPRFLPSLLGKTAATYLQAGTPLRWDHLAP